MIRLLDGPAAGVELDLLRAPVMLRVVRNGRGTWDALDQLDDKPNADESIYLYLVASRPTFTHISCRPRSKSRWIISADYRLYSQQPDDATLRNTAAWGNWCDSMEAVILEQLKAEGITT